MNTYGYICLTIITVAVLAIPSLLQRIAVALERLNETADNQEPASVTYVYPQGRERIVSTVTERTWTPTDDDLGPAKAHYAWATDRTTALCGKRLIGVDAPADHPCCEDCKRIYEGYVGTLRLWGER